MKTCDGCAKHVDRLHMIGSWSVGLCYGCYRTWFNKLLIKAGKEDGE
jgi:hypothetical protein